MKLSVSSIAWTEEEEAAAFALLRKHGVEYVELAPGRAFGKAEDCTAEMVTEWMKRLDGLRISSFQALLFGREDVHLFRDEASRNALHRCLEALCGTAGRCGASAMVFGAPGSRRRGEIPEAEAFSQAVSFFRGISSAAERAGTALAVEPNPAAYNCDFLTHVQAAADLVAAVGSPGVTLNLDCGELILNDHPLDASLDAVLPLVGHVHISLPFLAPVTEAHPAHQQVISRLRDTGYSGYVTLEMKRSPEGLQDLERAVVNLNSLIAA